MKIIKTFLILLFLTLPLYSQEEGEEIISAEEIIKRMEAHYINDVNFEIKIKIENYTNNKPADIILLKGIVEKGKVTSLTYLDPPNMRNKKIIIKGNEMWIIIPNTKNPIPISPSQRLMGGISFGDITRVGTGYSEDYIPRLISIQDVDGKNSSGKTEIVSNCYYLELRAKREDLTYNKINIWVDPVDFLPVKSEFISLSGKKMLKAYYTSKENWNERLTFTEVFLFDLVNKSRYSKIKYFDFNIISQTN